jgi:hypothetical protein
MNKEYTDQLKEDKSLNLKTKTRIQLRDHLKSNDVPYISLMKANSYIKDVNFQIIHDDKIQSIFISRAYNTERKQVTNSPDMQNRSKQKDGILMPRGVTPEHLLYASAMQGSITMIGNFVYTRFGYCWLDFGVKIWSGPFYITSREDVIDPGGFTSKVEFISAGNDPLNIKGYDEVDKRRRQLNTLASTIAELKKKK